MDEVQQYVHEMEIVRKKERENYLSVFRNIRRISLDGPALGGAAICLIGVAAGAANAIYRLDEGLTASFTYAAIGGLAGLVLGSVIAVGGTILGGLADADSGIDD